MSVFQFIKTKTFFIHIGLACAFIALLMFGAMQYLDSYTMHDEMIDVPDLRGKSVEEMQALLEKQELRFNIMDSLFDTKYPANSVIDQDPLPGEKVKYNRTIYLTVNSAKPPQVKMPDIQNVSLRQAIAMLETYGLKTGKLTYVPDFARNAVMGHTVKGRPIKPGTLIDKGTVIDLELGNGLSDETLMVPDVTGMTRSNAISILLGSSLNVGSEVYDKEVKDTSVAKVYKQVPAAGDEINLGSGVDLFFNNDGSAGENPEGE